MPGVWVWSLVGELRSYMTQGQNPKTSKRSNIVTNYKDFKNDLSISKSLLKKSDFIWYSALKWSESWSVVSNSATHSTSMGFSRPEYWCGWPFPSPGDLPNPGLPHCRRILYQLSHQGSPRILEWVAYPFSSRSSWPRNQTRVCCVAGRFFTSWATREAPYLTWVELYSLRPMYFSLLVACMMDFPCGSAVTNLLVSAGDAGLIPGGEEPLEEEMATHSSILAWEISWTEEPGGLQSMGS